MSKHGRYNGRDSNVWNTADEKSFISDIHRRKGPEGVKAYTAALLQRKTWDGLDRAKVMAHADRLMRVQQKEAV